MAFVQFRDLTTGEEVSASSRAQCGDPEAPRVVFHICEPGQFIDPDSDELRLIPAPPAPEFERIDVAVNTDDEGEDVEPVNAREQAFVNLEEWRRDHPSGIAETVDPVIDARERMMDRRAAEIVLMRPGMTLETARMAIEVFGRSGGMDQHLREEDFA